MKLIIIFLAVNFIADMIGLDPRNSLLGSIYRDQGFLLLLSGFIFYLAARQINKVELFYKPIITSALILSGITTFEFIMLTTHHIFPTYNGRVVATMGNPDFLGAYLVMCLPFILFTNFNEKLFKPLWSLIVITSIIITQSRSAILALVIVLSLYFVSRIKIKLTFKIVLIISPLLAILFVIFQTSIFSRESIWDTRALIWNEGVKAVIKSPLIGYGEENFEQIFPRSLNFKVDNSHNIFLEEAVSTGLIGLFIFCFIVFLGIKRSKITVRLSLLAFLITSLFNPQFIVGIILFWILLGTREE